MNNRLESIRQECRQQENYGTPPGSDMEYLLSLIYDLAEALERFKKRADEISQEARSVKDGITWIGIELLDSAKTALKWMKE